MKQYELTNINRLFAKIDRDYGMEGLNEDDVIEWIGEALDHIGAQQSYRETVGMLEVKNHQTAIPKGFHAIIQLARNNSFHPVKNEGLCAKEVVAELAPVSKECGVPLDCNGNIIDDYNVAYYRPFFDIQYNYFDWVKSDIYHRNFTPIRLATSTFYSSVVCTETSPEIKNLYSTSKDEYTIIGTEFIRFSFKDGQVALAYLKQMVDNEGYPMIPDSAAFMEACTQYVILKDSKKNFYKKREGSTQVKDTAEKDWQWYCNQAKNEAYMFSTIDDHQNLLDQKNYLMPRTTEYFNFFGKLANPENRAYLGNNIYGKSRY